MMSSRFSVDQEWTVDEVLALFKKFRGVDGDEARTKWLYLENPAGRAEVWMLRRGGEAIGFTAGLPRELWIHGKLYRGLVGSDFSIDVRYRTLGPALILRSEAKKLIDAGKYDFLCAHPLPAMLLVHRRVGHHHIGGMCQWTLPLNLKELLTKGGLPDWFAEIIGPPGNVVLSSWRKLLRLRGGQVTVQESEEPLGGQDALDRLLAWKYPVVGRRDRCFVSWRYSRNPQQDYRLLTALNGGGGVLGYLAFRMQKGHAVVKDLAAREVGASAALMGRVAEIAAGEGVRSISINALQRSQTESLLRPLGLIPRPDPTPVVCYGGPHLAEEGNVEDAAQWFMTDGDRDT